MNLWWCLIVSCLFSPRVSAQEQEIQQLLLNVEKLTQFKQILEDMKEGYEVLSQGYLVIKNLSEGNFNLHQLFLDGLLQVSPAVRNYFKVSRIVTMQKHLLEAANRGYDGFAESNVFSPDELLHFKHISNRIVSQSLEHIASLTMVISAGKLRMSDAERLSAIDGLFDEVSGQLQFMTDFNNTTGVLALRRFKEIKDIEETKVLHGLK